MKIRFLAPAEAELLEAIAYYNQQSEGLGVEALRAYCTMDTLAMVEIHRVLLDV